MGDAYANAPISARRSVLVVDDHRSFCDLFQLALSGLPDLTCVGAAHSAEEAVTLCQELQPDLVVMDVRLGGDDGIATARELVERHPAMRIVVLTAYADRALMQQAADAGVCSVLPKDGSLPDVLHALRTAERGSFAVHPALLRALVAPPSVNRRAPELTARELQVLQMLGDGIGVGQIATHLGISVNTCRGYVKTLMTKLGAHSQLQAVAVARSHGLLDAPSAR